MKNEADINYIRKRDGRIVPFNIEKVTDAIFNAAQAVGGSSRDMAEAASNSVFDILKIVYKDGRIPTVENVQDLVEKMLIERGHAKHLSSTVNSTGVSGRAGISLMKGLSL